MIVAMTEDSKNFLFALIVITNCIFFIYWIKNFFQESRHTIREKSPALYTTLFLCCKKKRLNKELKLEEFRVKVSPFLRQIDKTMKCKEWSVKCVSIDLDKRRGMYSDGEIPIDEENLKKLLVLSNDIMK